MNSFSALATHQQHNDSIIETETAIYYILLSDYRPLLDCRFWPLAAKSDSRR